MSNGGVGFSKFIAFSCGRRGTTEWWMRSFFCGSKAPPYGLWVEFDFLFYVLLVCLYLGASGTPVPTMVREANSLPYKGK